MFVNAFQDIRLLLWPGGPVGMATWLKTGAGQQIIISVSDNLQPLQLHKYHRYLNLKHNVFKPSQVA